jgi:hypothetical protein
MGFGVRIGKPPDSGKSAAADLEEQWNLRASETLARRGRASVVPTQDGPLFARRTAEPGRLDGAPVSLRTTPRVISSMRLHIKDRDSAPRLWQVRRFAWR